MEAKFALAGGAADIATLDAYQRAANSLRRLLESVGLERGARDVTPTLEQYLARKAAGAVSISEAPLTAGSEKRDPKPPHEAGAP
jgi:hypothetical protein